MSGSGRRSNYRKSVTNDFLNSFPELSDPNEVIARVVGSRGTNVFEIEVVNKDCNDGTHVFHIDLALMPSKFKKLIWIKRGDYLIVTNSQDQVQVESDEININMVSTATAGKIQYMISHVLTKEQILHIQSIDKWPSVFDIHQHVHRNSKNDAYSMDDIMNGSQNNKRGKKLTSYEEDIGNIDYEDTTNGNNNDQHEELEELEEEIKLDKYGNSI